MEEEQSGQLPFLKVMVKRQKKNQLIFDVYRKPTSTKIYITADTIHPQSRKNANLHSMAHRLCNFNLSEEKYLKEKDTIVQIGKINGYQREIIRKYENIRRRQPTKKIIYVPFFPAITNKLKKVFTRNNLEIVTTSEECKLKNKLISTKDKKDPIEKSGIYEIKCGTQNCGYKYISQTRPNIKNTNHKLPIIITNCHLSLTI
jgi:hypothetical protein